MRLKDVPISPAYLVFHDSYDNGAMEIFPFDSISEAQAEAEKRQSSLDNSGYDECGIWRAYEKLPCVRVWKLHTKKQSQILVAGLNGGGE